MLSQMPSLFGHILATYETNVATQKEFTWSVELLRTIVRAVLGDRKVKEVVLILDALDECLDHSRDTVLSFVTKTITEHQSCRIFITSRPGPLIEGRLGENPTIQLHEVNCSDIRDFIVQELEGSVVGTSIYDDNAISELVELIITRAQGIFLWVSFVVKALRDESHNGGSITALNNTLNAVPGDLWGIYEAIVGQMETGREGESEGRKMLEWVVFAKIPMTLPDLMCAITIGGPGVHSISSLERSDAMTASASQLEKRLLSASSGLLEVKRADRSWGTSERIVQLIHQSAKDYLLSTWAPTLPSTGRTVSLIQTRLTCDCVSYITSIGFNTRTTPFARYAIEYWMNHATGAEDMIQMEKFCWPSRARFNVWTGALAYRHVAPSPLAVAARIGSWLDVMQHLEFGKSMNRDYYAQVFRDDWTSVLEDPNMMRSEYTLEYNQAWSMAAQFGHECVVQLLIDQESYRPENVDLLSCIEIALYSAARSWQSGLVQFLIHTIEHRSVPRGSMLNETFLIAAASSAVGVLEVLLRNNVDVNWRFEKDGRLSRIKPISSWATDHGATALHLVAMRDDLEAVQLLLDAGALVNLEDAGGCTALHEAAARGHEQVVDLLINRGATVNFPPRPVVTSYGSSSDVKCPLSTAAAMGQTDMVKMRLGRGADIESHTSDGRTALHEAVAASKIDVVRVLIARRCNVNSGKGTCGTPLYDATASKDDKIAKLLLLAGADVLAEMADGSTAFHNAGIRADWRLFWALTVNIAETPSFDPDTTNRFEMVVKHGYDQILTILRREGDLKLNFYSTIDNHMSSPWSTHSIFQPLINRTPLATDPENARIDPLKCTKPVSYTRYYCWATNHQDKCKVGINNNKEFLDVVPPQPELSP